MTPVKAPLPYIGEQRRTAWARREEDDFAGRSGDLLEFDFRGPIRMAKRPTIQPHAPPKTSDEMRRGLDQLRRVRQELADFSIETAHPDRGGEIEAIRTKIDIAVDRSFPRGSVEHRQFSAASRIHGFHSIQMSSPFGRNLGPDVAEFQRGLRQDIPRSLTLLDAAIQQLEQDLAYLNEPPSDDPAAIALRAYEGLDLHAEIARAVSGLFRDGHYANAVEDAVKALNALVRLRSGIDADGSSLMERAFSPTNPVLKFNALTDQTDRDEQKGFMMMFSGAVAGLRNPRAHRLMVDTPEDALEFIAFTSLLAKLLDRARK